VLHVNTTLASRYADLVHTSPSLVHGAARDPGESDFNPGADLPSFAGKSAASAEFRNRIIGDVRMANTLAELDAVMGRRIALRADEGESFVVGKVARMQDRVTFHALEHSGISTGHAVWYGFHVVVHGGADDGNAPVERTKIADSVVVKDWAVVFRSTIGAGSVIGTRAYVDGSQLAPGTVVPDRAIIIDNKTVGSVEW
jgi:carbonic anhydrase/acetyltransferase-like protein (isoleucine patch superfamily)